MGKLIYKGPQGQFHHHYGNGKFLIMKGIVIVIHNNIPKCNNKMRLRVRHLFGSCRAFVLCTHRNFIAFVPSCITYSMMLIEVLIQFVSSAG